MLIVVVFALALAYPSAESGLVAALNAVVLYMIDYPISVVMEAMRPGLPDFWVRYAVFFALYLFVGGALWYAVGLVTAWVSRRLGTQRSLR